MKLRLSRATRLKLLLLACGMFAGLLLAELALRIAGVSHPVLYAPDEYCASRLRAGARGWWTSEGRAYIRISSARLRDREHSVNKPPGTFRIAVLGDSYSEALQVPLEETFWSILERRLTGCEALHGKSVEVLNFGVSGYGTAQELLTLRHYALQFEPDLVLLAFCTGNDVRNNSKALEREAAKAYFEWKEGKLVLDESFRQSRPYLIANSTYERTKVRLLDASYLLQLLWYARQNWNRAPASPSSSPGSNTPAAATLREAEQIRPVYGAPADADWKQAWDVTERLLDETAREARRHGAMFCVATLSNGIQVFPDPAVRERFLKETGSEDLFYTDRRVRRAGERGDFPVLNLAPELQRLADEKQVFLHGFDNTALGIGHWNAVGHEAAGKLLAEWLCTTLEAETAAR